MSDTVLELGALTALLLRDGRPFAGGGEESRARSLPAPLPHTLAGFIRTQLGNANGLSWRGLSEDALHERLRDLHGTPVRSLLTRDGTFMFPAPLNAAVDKNGTVYHSRPHEVKNGEGTNLPEVPEGLRPLTLLPDPGDSFKPESGYTYWPAETMKAWLLGDTPPGLEKIGGPPEEERTHVSIDPQTGAGVDGELFSVTYRSFEERGAEGQPHRWTIRVKTDLKGRISPIGHLGGERRPVTLKACSDGADAWPNKGQFEKVTKRLLEPVQKRICFILTSPALFKHGWRPAWLDEDTGPHTPAGVGALRGHAKLVGAAVGRRVPVSGWNLRADKPKAVRWAVPAGSVYFLEVTKDFDRDKLLGAWLKPLSDLQNDQRDGFGCALWGVW